MIDALLAGKLVGGAVERTTSSIKTFVTCKVRAADSDGEAQFVNVVAFNDGVKAALLALGDGESVSLSGSLTAGIYEARDGTKRVNLKLIASSVLSVYHVRKRREATAQAASRTPTMSRPSGTHRQRGSREAAPLAGNAIPDDDVAF